MNKKLIVFSILMFLTLSIFTLSYGTDIVMDLDNSSNSNSLFTFFLVKTH